MIDPVVLKEIKQAIDADSGSIAISCFVSGAGENKKEWLDFVTLLLPEDSREPLSITPLGNDLASIIGYVFPNGTIATLAFSESPKLRVRFEAHRGETLIYMDDLGTIKISRCDKQRTVRL